MRHLRHGFGILIVFGLTTTAHAYATGDQFDAVPTAEGGGGGGIAFDGAPRWTGHACDVCHTSPAGQIGIKLEADHPTLFTEGWDPKKQYHLRIDLLDQHAGLEFAAAGDKCGAAHTPYTPCDQNGFALEIANAAGKPVGTFAAFDGTRCVATPPVDASVYILKDGTAVTHRGLHFGVTRWDFCWTSPAAGAGTITAFVSAVDGNGGDGTAAFPSNATDDDVETGVVPLPERAVGGADAQTGGCSAAGDPGLVVGVLGALAVLGFLRPGRRRRHQMLAVGALATAMLGGCAHVRPRQREVLARKNMKFAPDTAEDELDLHMREAREGSTGGYGSSGGGCGCN
ncbi:MAG: DUF4266 domain-containing protein [Proteobacteria bacterium]|nr:DUF4266 domain-containing protein [Pseudomonadota bacterium]